VTCAQPASRLGLALDHRERGISWLRGQERPSHLINRQCCCPVGIEIREPLLRNAAVVGGFAGW